MRAPRPTTLLLAIALAAGICSVAATPAQAAQPKVQYTTYTTVLSPAALFAGADRTTNYAKYGGCQLAGGKLACWANPAGAAGNEDPHPLWASATFYVPEAVAAAAEPGTLSMQVTAAFSHLSGRIDWDYGGSQAKIAYAHLPTKHVKAPKFITLNGSFTANGRMTPTVDFGFTTGSRATFKQVTITYRYVAKSA